MNVDEADIRDIDILSLLFEISKALDERHELREMMMPVLKIMADEMNLYRGTLTIVNRETNEISTEIAYGISQEKLQKGKYLLGEGIIGSVVETGEPIIVQQISKDNRFLNRTGARNEQEDRELSFLCVPIISDNNVIGTLSVDCIYENNMPFDQPLKLLNIIASMISKTVCLYQTLSEEKSLQQENDRLNRELKNKFQPSNIIGKSRAMNRVYTLIERVSHIDNTTVLILGDSGVGKELVAKAIHYNSSSSSNPFIPFNCGAIPENLIESELFGHEKGAFTGATNMREGKFEAANGGTIFLDEVGELSLSAQTKLLRILQEREFQRVGGNTTIKVDLRVIAATNRDLEDLVNENKFRTDLYYRLNVFPINVPQLKDRKTDIPLLIDFFIEKYSTAHNIPIRRITTSAIDMLMSYHWPGNVRELENTIERVVILSSDGVIHSYHLPPTLQTATSSETKYTGTLNKILENVEREMIIDSLKNTKGNMTESAKELGITERIIGLRVRKYRINHKEYRT